MNTLEYLAGKDIIDGYELMARLGELEEQGIQDEDEFAEQSAIEALVQDVGGAESMSDSYFVLDSYFEEYAYQYADEIGAIDHSAGWPLDHIDWEGAAADLKTDFMSITIGGYDYWYR